MTAKRLRVGTVRCPADGFELEFLQVAGSRVYRALPNGRLVFDSKCPRCKRRREVYHKEPTQ